jgi:hypothetical protein
MARRLVEKRRGRQHVEQDLVGLRHPSTVVVAGPTGSGKTRWIIEALAQGAIRPPPQRVVWVFGERQPALDDLSVRLAGVEFVHASELAGPDSWARLYRSFSPDERSVLVLDDMMLEAVDNREVARLFAQGSHHRNLTVVLLLQNMFAQGRAMRSVALNAQYYVLFRNPRDRTQISYLARQMFPNRRQFLVEAFEDATRRPYGYLLVDLRPGLDDDRLRVRTNVLPSEGRPLIYHHI